MANRKWSFRRFSLYLRSAAGLLLLALIAGGLAPVALAHDDPAASGSTLPVVTHAGEASLVLAQAQPSLIQSASGPKNAEATTVAPLVARATPPNSSASTLTPSQASSTHKVIYLTFDDGPSEPWTQKILNVLARYHAHATFFVVGQDARVHPDLLKAIVAGGNVIGNHTWDHPWLDRMTRAQVLGELKRTQKVLGPLAASCMRPPYGAANHSTRAEAAQLGMKLVMWDIDPLDWSRPGTARIVARILTQASPGATVLMHDGFAQRDQTVAALSIVLRTLAKQGYRFETEPVCRH